MKTDPEHTDYTMEQGATRNYEPWREKDKVVAQAKAQREEEERGNAMKVCHNMHCCCPTCFSQACLRATRPCMY
jgi:hypothetical protein